MSLDARPPDQQIRSFSAESYAPRVPRPLESYADPSNKKPSEAVQFCTCGFEGYNEGTRQKRCILHDPRPLVTLFLPQFVTWRGYSDWQAFAGEGLAS